MLVVYNYIFCTSYITNKEWTTEWGGKQSGIQVILFWFIQENVAEC
jgi:hypothetical protein